MRIFSALFTILFLASCQPKNEEIHTYWVNSYKVPCQGVAPMECLLIQKNEEIDPKAWTYFYSSIEGFEFESLYLTKLKVREITKDINETPADASSIDYELVEVLSKELDSRYRINDIWVLTALDEKPIEIPEGAEAPYIEVNLKEQRIMGNDGCNEFSGPIDLLTPTSIQLGNLVQTEMACMSIDYAYPFMQALQSAHRFTIGEGTLVMMEEGKERLRFKKVD